MIVVLENSSSYTSLALFCFYDGTQDIVCGYWINEIMTRGK